MAQNDVNIEVHHGLTLPFQVLPMSANWADVGGVYIFCKPGADGSHLALYIGKTESFAQRFSRHERWPEAVQKGATHLLVTLLHKEADRVKVESALIQKHKPPMNQLGLLSPTLRW